MIFEANKAKKSSKKGRKGEKSRPIVGTGNEDKKESCVDPKVQLEENNDSIVQEEKPLCEDDYHESMNGDRYEKYFPENICYNAPTNSAIVIDNALYLSENTEHYPKCSWRKQQHINWLTKNGISFNKKSLRADLWVLVKRQRGFPIKSDRRNCKEFWP